MGPFSSFHLCREKALKFVSLGGNLRNHQSPKTRIGGELHFVTDLSPRPAVANPFWCFTLIKLLGV